MNMGSNYNVFEEFQRSVDRAVSLAKELAPEHFQLAFDRCSKLQKTVFKRACGYCCSNDSVEGTASFEPQKVTPFNLQYMNLPTLSLYAPLLSIIAPSHTNTDASKIKADDRTVEVSVDKLVLLRHSSDNVPSMTQMNELEEGLIIYKCNIPLYKTVEDTVNTLMKYFPNAETSCYELCLPDTNNHTILKVLQDSDLPLQRQEIIFLRPLKGSEDSTLSPLSSFQSEDSSQPVTVNSFILDNDKEMSNSKQNKLGFTNLMEVDAHSPKNVIPRQQRKYNWNVVLTKLHEKLPESLDHEILPLPNKCHELHVIPPTSQKLRPTKRCQLCLKGYRSRKESRYFCGACGKGFHIKCFDVYHGQVGCTDFKVKIIDADH